MGPVSCLHPGYTEGVGRGWVYPCGAEEGDESDD